LSPALRSPLPSPRILIQCAVSADGFIARPDGSIDWLPPVTGPDVYDMGAFMARVGTIVWGHRTFEQVLGLGPFGGYGEGTRHVVLTHRPPPALVPPGVAFSSEDAASLAHRLRAAPGKDVWVMGGADVHAQFLDAGEVDEVMLHVVPALLGDGIPLARPHPGTALRLLETRAYPDGVVRLHYEAIREGRRG
jgi:dihydrofolate reductase